MLSQLSGLTHLGLGGECGSPLHLALCSQVTLVVDQGSVDVSHADVGCCATGNNIGAAGMASLVPAVRTLRRLTYLDLGRTFGFSCMGHVDAMAMLAAWKCRSCVLPYQQRLNVCAHVVVGAGNATGDAVVVSLARAVRGMERLTYLDLSGECAGLALGPWCRPLTPEKRTFALERVAWVAVGSAGICLQVHLGGCVSGRCEC